MQWFQPLRPWGRAARHGCAIRCSSTRLRRISCRRSLTRNLACSSGLTGRHVSPEISWTWTEQWMLASCPRAVTLISAPPPPHTHKNAAAPPAMWNIAKGLADFAAEAAREFKEEALREAGEVRAPRGRCATHVAAGSRSGPCRLLPVAATPVLAAGPAPQPTQPLAPRRSLRAASSPMPRAWSGARRSAAGASTAARRRATTAGSRRIGARGGAPPAAAGASHPSCSVPPRASIRGRALGRQRRRTRRRLASCRRSRGCRPPSAWGPCGWGRERT